MHWFSFFSFFFSHDQAKRVRDIIIKQQKKEEEKEELEKQQEARAAKEEERLKNLSPEQKKKEVRFHRSTEFDTYDDINIPDSLVGFLL